MFGVTRRGDFVLFVTQQIISPSGIQYDIYSNIYNCIRVITIFSTINHPTDSHYPHPSAIIIIHHNNGCGSKAFQVGSGIWDCLSTIFGRMSGFEPMTLRPQPFVLSISSESREACKWIDLPFYCIMSNCLKFGASALRAKPNKKSVGITAQKQKSWRKPSSEDVWRTFIYLFIYFTIYFNIPNH